MGGGGSHISMYTTVSVKNEWQTVFCCGNPDAKEVVLILGSCRVVPYLNYMSVVNQFVGNRFKIFCIDPVNYQIDSGGNLLDTRGLLKALETDEHFLSILRSVTVFIHEGLSSFGILNTVKPEPGDTWEKPVTIYDFGMQPWLDVNIPNYHDLGLLVNDVKAIDSKYRDRELTVEDEREIYEAGERHIDRFCNICALSSFPEFGQWFRDNYLERRLFHSFNHVSAAFTLEIFRLMNEKFLKLDLPQGFWNHPDVQADIYANNSTPVTELDRKWRAWKFQ